jgi:Xaa-Pro aminopeptidase
MMQGPFEASEMHGRLARIRSRMASRGLDALVVSAPVNVRYATGFRGEPATLWITGDDAILMTSYRSERWARAQTDTFEVICELDPVVWIRRKTGTHKLRIGVDWHITHHRLASLRKAWPEQEVEPTNEIELLRRIKSEAEIARLRQSQEVNERIFDQLLDQIRPGFTERAAQGMILAEMAALEEVEAPAFTPIVAAGPNAWEIHHQPDGTVLKQGDMVIIDLGVKVGGYASDMTRTICLGSPTDRMCGIHAKVREAQLAAIAMIRDGVLATGADAAARDVIRAAGHGRGYTHGLGHGIGLDTHDADLRMTASAGDLRLQRGMALTVEPGIYLEDEFGVRTEDVVIVRDDGVENLTRTTHELIEILT